MPIIRQPLSLSTQFAESVACHAIDKFGFFTIAQKVEGARTWQERSYRLEQLPTVLGTVGSGVDTYISQASFARPNRRIANLARVGLLWVDLDIYNMPALAGKSPEQIAPLLLQACEDRMLPPPSVLIDSGQGLYAKWFLDTPIPARALSRWQLVQNTFCDRLADFGADKQARDAARVLRIVDSVHKIAGRPVSVLWENKTPTHGGLLVNGIASYSFETLALELLPLSRERLAELRAERDQIKIARNSRMTGHDLTLVGKHSGASRLRTFIPSQLAWDRYHDIIKLADLRGWQAGAPSGHRDVCVFLAAAFMAHAVIVPQFHLEVAAIAKRFAPTWTRPELESCVSSVLARAQAAEKGEKIEYKGQLRDPRYFFKNASLLALLDITPEEEQQLTTIVSPTEAKRRDAERARRARQHAGAVERARYLGDADQRRARSKMLREQGKSWAEVGAELGVSTSAARMLAARCDEKRTSPSVYM